MDSGRKITHTVQRRTKEPVEDYMWNKLGPDIKSVNTTSFTHAHGY